MDSNHRWLMPAGLTAHSEVEISEAIQICAKMCFTHSSPHECIEPHLAQLLREGWTEHDVNEVRSGALHVIATITGQTE
jgi:hypothetical protein